MGVLKSIQKKRRILLTILSLVSVLAVVKPTMLTQSENKPEKQDITIQAVGRGNPFINFEGGRELPVEFGSDSELVETMAQNGAESRAMTSADFDEDGMPDLVCGYALNEQGILTFRRGNIDSLYSNTANSSAPRFLALPTSFEISSTPDFLVAGDFDADGRSDLVAAARDDGSLYFLRGDGNGAFQNAERIELHGKVSALIAGEINRADGLTDIVVGIERAGEARVLVFESPTGAVKGEPEEYSVPARATALALGRLSGKYTFDLAIAAGSDLLTIRGRDRKLSLGEDARHAVTPAEIDRQSFPFVISSLTTGDFTDNRGDDLALLSTDGRVQVLKRNGDGYFQANDEIALSSPANLLVKARVSTGLTDDLIAVDSTERSLEILSTETGTTHYKNEIAASARLRISASLECASPPVALLPMRLNPDALNDLVVLNKGSLAPTVLMSAPMATFIVTNTNDSGAGSLRQAIIDANNSPGADMITFNIPGGGVQTITLASAMLVSESVTIDGYTQPGSSVNTLPDADNAVLLVELNGTGISGVLGGLIISPPNTVVRGLVINRFSTTGVYLQNSNCIIEGNFIGTDPTGTLDLGNTGNGITSQTSFGNNMFGGTSPAARNIVSGNNQVGINIRGTGDGNFVRGNFIGIKASGNEMLGNGQPGVVIHTDNNTIGGTVAGSRNIISANAWSGLEVRGGGNLVQGNYIGTDSLGLIDLGNQNVSRPGGGVDLAGGLAASNNTVGGTTPEARNIISGTGQGAVQEPGMDIRTSGSGTLIQGNFIGTTASGISALGNAGNGIDVGVSGGTGNCTVGGVTPGAGNTIAFNNGDGVFVGSGAANNPVRGNSIRGNSIFTNGGLAIDLSLDGVNTNDACDGDTGANLRQNFPVLTSAATSPFITTISGSLNSAPSTAFTIDFYTNSACDPSSNGEGQTYIGSTTTTTNASCIASFMVSLPVGVAGGSLITATATDPFGNTSEFSACIQVSCLTSCSASSPGIASVGSPVQFTGDFTFDCPTSPAFNWSFGDLSPDSSLQNPSHVYTTPGFFRWKLTINIDGSPVCTRTGTISVSPTAPVINNFSPTGGFAGTTVTISGLNFNGATDVRFNGLSASFSLDSPSQITAIVPAAATTGPITVQTPAGIAVNAANFLVGTVRIIVNSSLDNNIRDLLLTLREAILIANGTLPKAALTPSEQALVIGAPSRPSLDEIRFNIGAGPQTISLSSALDTITGPVVMDAATQPGFTGNPIIELDGANAGAGASGLRIAAGGSTVRGLVINRFSGDGILLQSVGGNLIVGNFIGTSIDGNANRGNGRHGVNMLEVSDNLIGGIDPASRNVISGNSGRGVSIVGDSNRIQGNFIGVGDDGSTALGNELDGVSFFGSNNTIGARLNPDGTVSGLRFTGLSPTGGTETSNTIAFNLVGVRGFGSTSGGESSGNSILSNLIYSNQTAQIQMQTACPSADCTAPPPASAGQGPPVLDSVTFDEGTMTITGMVVGEANTNYYLQFFLFDMCSGGIPSGSPQSLASLPILQRTNSFGSASFAIMLQVTNAESGFVNATSTDPENNTSPFSFCAQINGGCSFSITPNSLSYPPEGGANGVAVTTGSSCQWTAVSNNPEFITITTGDSGAGAGVVTYMIAANLNSSPRTGTMTIAGQTFVVSQNGQSCSFSIGADSQSFGPGGGAGNVTVAVGAGCNWTAVSNNPNFITIVSPLSGGGSGDGTVSFIVETSDGPFRTGTISVAGQTFTVTQDSGCSYFIDLQSQSFAASAATGTVNVIAGTGCEWTAVSNNPEYITITSGDSGSGSGTITYSVAANSSTSPRSGTITIAGSIFTLAQGALFNDVAESHPFFSEVSKLSARGVTLGCGGGNYCPDQAVTREQMAAFIIRARGELSPPPPEMQRFGDVLPTNPFYAFIDRMANLQITLGCGGGNYCPSDAVTREQMAAFIIRSLSIFNPPQPAQQRFGDVPPSNPFYGFIEEMAVRRITLGCGGGNYCPTQSVTRAQMAAFLVRAFGL